MEDTALDLIAQLGTQIAMTMEDAVEDALTLGAGPATDRKRRLQELERAASRISRLVAAALALES